MFGLPEVYIQGAQAADENRHLRSGQRQQLRPIQQQFLSRQGLSASEIVAEPVSNRFKRRKGVHIGLLLRSVRAPRRERYLHVVSGFLRRRLDGCAAAQNNQVSERNLLPAGLRSVELLLDPFERLQHLSQLSRLVDFPILLRREANARAVRATALVGAAERRRRRPGSGDRLGDRQSGREDLGLQSSNILLPDQRMIHCGNRILP